MSCLSIGAIRLLRERFDFQHPPDAAVQILLCHSEHVAVKIRAAIQFQTRNRETEPDHPLGIKSAKSLAADLGRDDKEPHRKQLDIVKAPNLSLKIDGVLKFRLSGERTNRHLRD